MKFLLSILTIAIGVGIGVSLAPDIGWTFSYLFNLLHQWWLAILALTFLSVGALASLFLFMFYVKSNAQTFITDSMYKRNGNLFFVLGWMLFISPFVLSFLIGDSVPDIPIFTYLIFWSAVFLPFIMISIIIPLFLAPIIALYWIFGKLNSKEEIGQSVENA